MSLSDLSNELIVRVFECVDNISSAAALSHTSHHLHTIWRYHLASICDVVLPRTIECYNQARQLLDARAKSSLVDRQSSVEDKAKAAIIRAKVLLSNADYACLALSYFEAGIFAQRKRNLWLCACTGILRDQRGNRTLEPFSRIRFLQGYYRAMSTVYLSGESKSKLRYKTLASMHLLDYFRTREIMEWISYEYCEAFIPDEDTIVARYDFGPSNSGKAGDFEHFSKNHHFLDILGVDLVKVSGVERPMDEFGVRGPTYELILHDDCLKGKTDRAKGVELADLLPLLPENSSINPQYELLASH